jgi:nickel-dependent lactate racemase
VHDITDLESRGLPGVFIASTEFVTAAHAQARALGFDPARVFVPHPIQDRTDDEIAALAEAAVDEILAVLVDTDAGSLR